jgi:hypothetical protein
LLMAAVEAAAKVETLDELVAAHENDGEAALDQALKMHKKELQVTTEALKNFQEPVMVERVQECCSQVQEGRIASIQRLMRDCEELLESIDELDYPGD